MNCPICGKNRVLERHHKKPRSLGGSDDEINIMNICRACHRNIHDCKGDWKLYRTKSFQQEGKTIIDYEESLKK